MNIDPLYYSDGFKAVVRKDCTCQTLIRPERDVVTGFYTITMAGLIIARAGYVYDFATGAFDTDTIKRGSLFHDIVCQAIREGLLDPRWQEVGDELLRDICRLDGMCRPRVWWVFTVVRKYQARVMEELILKRASLPPEAFREYLQTKDAHPVKIIGKIMTPVTAGCACIPWSIGLLGP